MHLIYDKKVGKKINSDRTVQQLKYRS